MSRTRGTEPRWFWPYLCVFLIISILVFGRSIGQANRLSFPADDIVMALRHIIGQFLAAPFCSFHMHVDCILLIQVTRMSNISKVDMTVFIWTAYLQPLVFML